MIVKNKYITLKKTFIFRKMWTCRIFTLLFIVLLCLFFGDGKSVLKNKNKDKATVDQEVLLDDEDYEEDVLDLSLEERKERLEKLVNRKIDANSDGFVDQSELQKWCIKAFDKFEKDDAKEDFDLIDLNKDKLISWKEHFDDSFGEGFEDNDPRLLNPDESNPEAVEQARNFVKEKKLFEAADADGDNFLDTNEYFIFKQPRRDLKTRQVIIADKLEHADLDKDGSISFEEYMKDEKLFGGEEDGAEHNDEVEEKFSEDLDKDKDGSLADEEIVNWVDPSNDEEAHDEADHLMEDCDTSNDGKLSLKEILDNHDIWVESDATDYGRHLMVNHDEF